MRMKMIDLRKATAEKLNYFHKNFRYFNKKDYASQMFRFKSSN